MNITSSKPSGQLGSLNADFLQHIKIKGVRASKYMPCNLTGIWSNCIAVRRELLL